MAMHRAARASSWWLLACTAALLAACGGGGGGGGTGAAPIEPVPPPVATLVEGPPWWGFGRDAQHTAVSGIASQDLNRVAWSTPVDQQPQYQASGSLLIHYGTPVITARNTVIVPVKTGATDGFLLEGRSGATGASVWSQGTDYRLPAANWIPSYGPVLTPGGRLYFPGAGGTVWVRDQPDAATGALQRIAFYGDATYAANATALNGSVFINTPITSDAQGNVYFGFLVTGTSNVAGLVGGIARIGADGSGRWVAAATAAGDATIAKAAMNVAPALSPDGRTLYAAVNTSTGNPITGYLVALDAATLTPRSRVQLRDPVTNALSRVSDNGTSSPAVGPDGRIYFGVLESSFPQHNARGWLLQFDANLVPVGAPGSFGWDVTPSIIPSSMVASYTGKAGYLLAVKYNNYAGVGTGDGQNRLAVLDPFAAQADSFSTAQVMKEVLTIAGPTPVPGGVGVYEWCINTMAADPATKSVLVNSEDGLLYRWDLGANKLTQSIRLTAGLGQAYTPTLIGADGAVYAISNARLFAVTR